MVWVKESGVEISNKERTLCKVMNRGDFLEYLKDVQGCENTKSSDSGIPVMFGYNFYQVVSSEFRPWRATCETSCIGEVQYNQFAVPKVQA